MNHNYNKTYSLLHCHSFFSRLDGFGSPKANIKRAKELGLHAISTTDHGNIGGLVEAHVEGKKQGIKTIKGCLLQRQEIVTINGVRNIEYLKEGDYVLTHEGRFRKVLNIFKKPYEGYVYSFILSNRYKRKLTCTEEHPVLIRLSNGEIKWLKPFEIPFGKFSKLKIESSLSCVCLPKIKSVDYLSNINLLENLPNFFLVEDDCIKKDCKSKYHKKTDRWKNIPLNIEIDKDFAYFIGLYVAEGSVTRNTKHPTELNGSINFSFHSDEEEYQSFIVKYLKEKFDIDAQKDCRVDDGRNGTEIICCCLPLAYFLSGLCGRGSHNKKIPNFIYNQPEEIRESFIKGLLDGDGKKNTDNQCLKVASKSLAWGFRQLLVNFGFWSSVSIIKDFNKKTQKEHIGYQVTFNENRKYKRILEDDDYLFKPINKIERLWLKTTVYNFEVEEDNSYVSDFILHNCELYLSSTPAYLKENRYSTHQVVWAKNKDGWKQLIQLISQTNDPEYFYYRPRIQLWNHTDDKGKLWKGLEYFCTGNIMSFAGHQGSYLSNSAFCDPFGDPVKANEDLKKAYSQYKGVDTEYYRRFLRPNWLDYTCELALKLEKLFGKGNFFIELQNELDKSDKLPLLIHPLIVECLREVSKQTNVPACCSSDPHYPEKKDAIDQRVMVAVNMKEDENSIAAKLNSSDDVMVFFGSDNFYIHSYEEMAKNFTKEELEMSNKIADMVEDYDILENPYIPKFDVPEFPQNIKTLENCKNNSDKYLLYLCIQGGKQLKPWLKSNKTKEEYWKRLKDETEIIFKVGLSDYFLVVDDICKAADNRPKDHNFEWQKNLKNNGEIDQIYRGVGRGSASNCLISYLIGITGVDSLKHDLLFSRFYNSGRVTKDHVSLCDIDLDFDVDGREWILDYIRWKYGNENVGQLISWQTAKGRGALKDVCRVKNINFDLANEITDCVGAESVIADEIQQMKEQGEDDYNILRWTLDNSTDFQKHYENPEIKPIIDQAIRYEGIKRGSAKHPSGIVVSNEPLENKFPMVYDPRSKQRIIGWDLKSSEKMSAAKFDILGVAVLSKLAYCQKLINEK